MKRRIYFLYIIWVQVVAISLSSCDDELTDINRNPNATENPQPAIYLPLHSIMPPIFIGEVVRTIILLCCGCNIGLKYNIQSQIAIMWIMVALPLRGTPAMQR